MRPPPPIKSACQPLAARWDSTDGGTLRLYAAVPGKVKWTQLARDRSHRLCVTFRHLAMSLDRQRRSYRYIIRILSVQSDTSLTSRRVQTELGSTSLPSISGISSTRPAGTASRHPHLNI